MCIYFPFTAIIFSKVIKPLTTEVGPLLCGSHLSHGGGLDVTWAMTGGIGNFQPGPTPSVC